MYVAKYAITKSYIGLTLQAVYRDGIMENALFQFD